jgi:hypothetical protein
MANGVKKSSVASSKCSKHIRRTRNGVCLFVVYCKVHFSHNAFFLFVKNFVGLFSMHIPGRVGYQCSNFYRSLIKQGIHFLKQQYYIIVGVGNQMKIVGKIQDESYVLDETGRPRFLFKVGFRF